MHVIVTGAGIGGLSAALLCVKQGMSVTLLEQAAALKEIGAGVQISSNGTVVLRELGLLNRADAVGVKPVSFRVLSFEDNSIISDMPLGPEAADRYGEAFYQFHRADLLGILADALPEGVLRLNSRLENFTQDDAGVLAYLADGTEIRGDVLIGADGIHSVIRKKLVGDGDTVFSGKLVWRALLTADQIRELGFKERFYGWAGPERMVWAYWVRAHEMFNFGGVVPANEVRLESWDETADLDELRESLVGANKRLDRLVHSIDKAFVTGLYDRDPLPRWSVGRVTLLGDSAHAMLPYLAQGACQALEDAYVLSSCLSRGDKSDPSLALQDYERRRRPRTTKVQTTARSTHIFWTENDPTQRLARNRRMRGLAQIDPLATTIWRWLYAYDVADKASKPHVDQDKRGARSVYETDSPAQRKAWEMWHDLFTEEEEASGIRGLRKGYDRFFGQFKPRPTTSLAKVTIGGVNGIWIDPEGTSRDLVVLHLHGGGFAFGSADCSVEYGERLAEAIDGRCLALNYRLAPEHPFPAALEDAVDAYSWLLSQGYGAASILISGESAGGGLAVATAMRIRDLGIESPAGVLVLSPLVDNSLKSESIDAFAGRDPIIDRDILTFMASGYFHAERADHPLVSPVYGNFEGLPPLLIQASKDEVLVDDAKRLAQAAASGGVDVRLHLYEERLHIFSLYPFLESAGQAMEEISDFSRTHLVAGKNAKVTEKIEGY